MEGAYHVFLRKGGVDAAASMPPEKRGEKPRDLINGIVKVPVPTTLAAADPEKVPNIAEDTIAACAGPPRNLRVVAMAIFRMASAAPVA